MTHSTWT